MVALLCFFLTLLTSPFKSRSRLEAENAALRQQLIILQCKVRGRVHFTNSERLFFIQLYRWFPSILKTITIIRPETLVRWHRAGFRLSAAAHTVLLRSSPAPVRYSSRYDAISQCVGRVNWKVAPWGTFAVAHTRPPCASMIERQIDSPMPMPLGLVV